MIVVNVTPEFKVAPPLEVVMMQNTPKIRPVEPYSGFNSFARHHGLSVTEQAILSALFRCYTPEEIAVIFGIEWPVK